MRPRRTCGRPNGNQTRLVVVACLRDDSRMASLTTRLCRELGIRYPVFSVGFGMGAGPDLAAAVSNAGGFGVLGGDGRSRELILEDIERTRALTERPFGVNFVIPVLEWPEATEEDRAEMRDLVEAAVEASVSAIVLFWGNPAPFVEDAHEHGVKLLVQIGSVAEAKAAVEAGVDAVIAQGVEAGGHVRGRSSIWDLLLAVIGAVEPVPVLASGGIGDGAGVARALELGAQGVSLGTRFVASDEAWFDPVHKQRVLESTAADTVCSELYDAWWPGARHRTLRNRTFDEWESAGRPPPGRRPGEDTVIGTRRLLSGEVQEWPRYAVGAVPPTFEGDLDRVPLLVGESCGVINDIKPAAQIVEDLVRETEASLAGHQP